MSRHLRIILAIGSLEIGGTERQVVRLARELHARGHEVTVLTITTTGPLGALLADDEIDVWEFDFQGLLSRNSAGRIQILSTLKLWRRWFSLVGGLRRRRPDVVHAFLFWSYVLVLPAAWLARVPIRISGRRNMGYEKTARPLYPYLERIADACSHYAVANAIAVADVVRERMPDEKVVVIPNGIDLPTAAQQVHAQPPAGMMVANLIAYKGHLDVIAAWDQLDDPPVLHCFGEGPERSRIERELVARGLVDIIQLHGLEPDVIDRYATAQFAVLASHEEGLPNAVMEAMATGLPVIATDVGGVPDLIEHDRTGLLVPPHDPDRLAEAVQRLVSDPAKRVLLGAAARSMIAARYSWERVVEEHEVLYLSEQATSLSPLR